MQGWIKLHRGFTQWEWYQDANTMRLFLHLLMTANHKEGKWQGQTIQRGQLVTSREHLAKELGLSIQNIRTSLSRLKSTSNITIKTTSRFTAITVCKYDTYQSKESPSNQPSNQPANHQVTTNKNNKEIKKEVSSNIPEKNCEEKLRYTIFIDTCGHGNGGQYRLAWDHFMFGCEKRQTKFTETLWRAFIKKNKAKYPRPANY